MLTMTWIQVISSLPWSPILLHLTPPAVSSQILRTSFIRLEAVLASVGALHIHKLCFPQSGLEYLIPTQRAVSTTPSILQPKPLTSVTALATLGLLTSRPIQYPSPTGLVEPGLKFMGCLYATRPSIMHALTPVTLVSSSGPADQQLEPVFSAAVGSATGYISHQRPPKQTFMPFPVGYQPQVASSAASST